MRVLPVTQNFLSRWSHTGILQFALFSCLVLSTASAQELALLRSENLDSGYGYGRTVFSDNGRVLMGISNGRVTLWEVSSQQEIATFRCKPCVCPAALTADGKQIVLLEERNTRGDVIKMISVDSQRILKEMVIDEENFDPMCLVVSTDGTTVATHDYRGMVRIYDLASGTPGPAFYANPTVMKFFPDGQRLITGGEDKKESMTLKVWDVSTGEMVTASRWQRNPVTSIDISGDGSLIASASRYEKAKLFKFDGKQLTVAATLPIEGRLVSISRDAKGLACTQLRSISIYEIPSGKHLATFRGTEPTSIALHPDGKILASTRRKGGSIRLWDIATAQRIIQPHFTRLLAERDAIQRMALTADQQTVSYLAGSNEVVATYDVQSRATIASLTERSLGDGNNYLEDADFDKAGNALLMGQDMVYLWKRGQEVQRFLSVSSRDTETGCFSPDGSLVAIITRNQTAVMTPEKELRMKLSPNKGGSICAISPDNHWLASAGSSNLTLFNIESGQEYNSFPKIGGDLVFSSDSRFLFGTNGSYEYEDSVWRLELATGRVDTPFIHYNGVYTTRVNEIAVADQLPILATADAKGLIRLWNHETGNLLVALRGHRSAVTAIDISADGKTAVSGDKSGYMCQWEIGEDILTLARADALAEVQIAEPGPDAWLNYSRTIQTDHGVSVTLSPLRNASKDEVKAALQEVLSQIDQE